MRPLPDESGSKNIVRRTRGGNFEIRRLTDQIAAYCDVDRDADDSKALELINKTRRALLRAHAIRTMKKRRN